MMKYKDMGMKINMPEALPVEGKKAKISYPCLTLTGDQVPDELKDANNETMCRFEIIARKTGDSIDTYAEGEPRRINLEVQKMAYVGKGGKATKEEYMGMNDKEREEYDRRDREVGEEEEEMREEHA